MLLKDILALKAMWYYENLLNKATVNLWYWGFHSQMKTKVKSVLVENKEPTTVQLTWDEL